MAWHAHTTGSHRHVWPDDDLIEHDIGERNRWWLDDDECVCGPTVEIIGNDYLGDIVLIVHNALDHRLEAP